LTFNGLHGDIFQKIVLFIITAVGTSNPTILFLYCLPDVGISELDTFANDLLAIIRAVLSNGPGGRLPRALPTSRVPAP
jgi:hypothetical protein